MSILNIGVSGLLAFQRAISVTGHNIANVNTEGYSRQRLELATRPPQYAGGGVGYIGSGVKQAAINRVWDQFVTTQLQTSTSNATYFSAFYDLSSRVDNLMADADAGLSPGMQRFFAAVQDVADDPTSVAARQVLLSESNSLVDRFNYLHQRLDEQRAVVNGQVRTYVDEINQLTGAIAELNAKVVEATGRAAGAPPNDLLDQRDSLVLKLSELVGVNTVEQDDGSLNVFIGNGQSVVVGLNSTTLVADAFGADPVQTEVGYRVPNTSTIVQITDLLSGGKLGAALDMRTSILDVAQNTLGRIAVGLSTAFNDQHALGIDLNGVAGGEFFRVPSPEVLAMRGNSTADIPAVSITDVSQLTNFDYSLQYDGANWSLWRADTGQSVAWQVDPNDANVYYADGMRIDVNGIAAANGDSYFVRPTRQAAAQLEVSLDDPHRIAAALPVPVMVSSNTANSGSGRVVGFEVIDDLNPNLTDNVNIVFNSATQQFDLFDDGEPPVLLTSIDLNYDWDTASQVPDGVTTFEYNGWRITVNGTPASGDRFAIEENPSTGVGDNRNALALGNLQELRMLGNGTTTLFGAYNAMVADVGVQTRQAEISMNAQQRLLEDARSQREAISGVNLDEEAANLVKFQQAYGAAAQVIAVSGTLFDTLLAATRR
jgi:flagellar hook-associated protein 1 FlgK